MREVSLVLTHVQVEYRESQLVSPAIQRYIRERGPRVYQLLNEPAHPFIDEGECIDSTLGEVPDGLIRVLRGDKREGRRIVIAGREEMRCLETTRKQLQEAGLNPSIFYGGVYAKRSNPLKRIGRHLANLVIS